VTRNFVSTVSIGAAPERVFAVLCDVERWPEWTSTMSSVQRMDSGAFGVGSTARVHQPRLRPALWQVTRFEANRDFTWTTHAPGLTLTAGHSIEPDGTGCRVALSFELSGFIAPLISLLYGGLIERYIATEARGLKQRSESAGAVSAP
jgi:uncharacterized membrane protein